MIAATRVWEAREAKEARPQGRERQHEVERPVMCENAKHKALMDRRRSNERTYDCLSIFGQCAGISCRDGMWKDCKRFKIDDAQSEDQVVSWRLPLPLLVPNLGRVTGSAAQITLGKRQQKQAICAAITNHPNSQTNLNNVSTFWLSSVVQAMSVTVHVEVVRILS